MKIVVTGTRGIPEIQGGVETHCQELYPRLAAMGHDVTVIRRTPYVNDDNRMTEYKGVKLLDIYAPRRKSFEAIIHTTLAVLRARSLKPDILHIHAVGPSIIMPLAKALGMRTVMTNHGPDYDRQKWGKLAKAVIRTGERLGTRFADRVIVISKVIEQILADKYGRTDGVRLIYNGVNRPHRSTSTDYIESLGLQPQRYVVAIGRFVEEKGFHDLVKAFAESHLADSGYRLAIAGDADHPDEYSERLKRIASENDVVLTGFIRGERMSQLMTNAALFCMPSYHEGLPIALLEAMSYELDAAVSNIPANRLDCLTPDDFFTPGDTNAIAKILTAKLTHPVTPRTYDLTPYDWDDIARRTEAVYKEICNE